MSSLIVRLSLSFSQATCKNIQLNIKRKGDFWKVYGDMVVCWSSKLFKIVICLVNLKSHTECLLESNICVIYHIKIA